MDEGKKPFSDGGNAKTTGNSTGAPEGDNKQNGSQVDEFIDKIQSSHSGDKAIPAGGAKPLDKRIQDRYSELSEAHDALLDELESSMDRSMQELDARYDREFSRLDDEAGGETTREGDTGEQHADRMDARLAECSAKMDILKASLEDSEDEVFKQCTREIDMLRGQLSAARRKLAGIEAKDEEAWDKVKEGLSGIMGDISRAVKSVVTRLREAR